MNGKIRSRLEKVRKDSGVAWNAIERDYVLSWILAGISRVPSLKDTLVFKGGTALRKCYFGDYRFSEDLDFRGPKEFLMETPWRTPCGKRAPRRNCC